jgi:hypothetical protein
VAPSKQGFSKTKLTTSRKCMRFKFITLFTQKSLFLARREKLDWPMDSNKHTHVSGLIQQVQKEVDCDINLCQLVQCHIVLRYHGGMLHKNLLCAVICQQQKSKCILVLGTSAKMQ